MPTKKYKLKLMKHRICSVARVVACASFLVLAIIGVSSLVRAMSLESVENQNGIPSSWQVASLGSPEQITVPITYWDQRQDDCNDPDRQFEWSLCLLYAKGIIPNVVKDHLGSDGLPIPTYNNNVDAWAAYHDAFTANVIGNDPVQTTDNFYRWFHEAYDKNGKQVSKQIDGRKVTFNKVAGTKNSYTYGSHGVFPIDDVDFSKDDEATGTGHNFHFTAHMQIPMKISADGTEQFYFLGDDDVWVFLNGQLVLDLGGLHMETAGSFTIDKNGNVISTVENTNVDQACRQSLPNPLKIGYSIYNNRLENSCKRDTKVTTTNTGFKPGDIVNLDFFYAERSTSESNTTITITNMNWPISADSDVQGKIVGKFENTESNLVQYDTYVKNRDPKNPLILKRLASYIEDHATSTGSEGQESSHDNTGFIPLSVKNLKYTTTPEDENSWTPLEISAPMNSTDGFTLANPITMQPSGQAGDTLYFRFFAETFEYTGNIKNTTAYYTELNGAAGVTYDHATISYTGKPTEPDNPPEQTYTVTINYEVDYGDEEPDPIIEAQVPVPYVKDDLKPGDTYNVPTPALDGYTPDQSVVTGEITDSDVTITVIYKKKPEEEKKEQHRVLIEYLHSETREPVQPPYDQQHEEGDSFVIRPEEIEGFTKDREEVPITVGNTDIHEIVLYTPKPVDPDPTDPDVPTPPYPPVDPVGPTNPTDPDSPTTPDTPETPNNPLPEIPILPNQNDDNLTFVAPLGEVAYVPNTGVVSDFIAPIFEQYFAEVVLSQGFVLAMLLIFAGSFATYFSLRRYLDLAIATRSNVTIKKMPKSVANSKTAQNMRKAAAKSTRKNTKTAMSAKKVSSKTSRKTK